MKRKIGYISIILLILASIVLILVLFLQGKRPGQAVSAPSGPEKTVSPSPISPEETADVPVIEISEASEEQTDVPSAGSSEGEGSNLSGSTSPDADTSDGDVASNTVQEPQARIDALIESVYDLRDYYITQLDVLDQSAREEYSGLEDADRTRDRRDDIASRYIKAAYSLEAECDGIIDDICTELGTLLLETDGDFTVINRVRYTYASEKVAKKDEIARNYSEYLN